MAPLLNTREHKSRDVQTCRPMPHFYSKYVSSVYFIEAYSYMPIAYMNGTCLTETGRFVRGRSSWMSLISRKDKDTEILSSQVQNEKYFFCDMTGIRRAEWTEGRRIYYGDIIS